MDSSSRGMAPVLRRHLHLTGLSPFLEIHGRFKPTIEDRRPRDAMTWMSVFRLPWLVVVMHNEDPHVVSLLQHQEVPEDGSYLNGAILIYPRSHKIQRVKDEE